MIVDQVLILAAGAGTRMGEIGRRLPKVLWPVFEKSILELEVLYARKMGAKKIYINVHNYKEKMLAYLNSNPVFEDVEILVEEDTLDIGGAVHNLAAKVGYTGSLLILNSDQFILFEEKLWRQAWEEFESADALLFTYDVNSSDNYNGLKTKDGKLVEIVPNERFPRDAVISTYTGMSLIKLESLEPQQGESRFFETVANPERLSVACKNINDSPYWDFGTLRRYWRSSFEVLEKLSSNQKDLFVEFLLETEALNREIAGKNTYNHGGKNVINLSGEDGINLVWEAGALENRIILSANSETGGLKSKKPGFIYNDLEVELG